MYFLGVQAAMTDQIAVEEQHGDLMAVARLDRGLAVDIDHIDADSRRCRQGSQLDLHLLTQSAAGT